MLYCRHSDHSACSSSAAAADFVAAAISVALAGAVAAADANDAAARPAVVGGVVVAVGIAAAIVAALAACAATPAFVPLARAQLVVDCFVRQEGKREDCCMRQEGPEGTDWWSAAVFDEEGKTQTQVVRKLEVWAGRCVAEAEAVRVAVLAAVDAVARRRREGGRQQVGGGRRLLGPAAWPLASASPERL